jgi:hypothetical protein
LDANTDLPGAGLGVLIGRVHLVGYFDRFMGNQDLCGTIDTVITQDLGAVTVYSGTYTFNWIEYGRPNSGRARYTYVVVMTPEGPKIVTHHSSELPQ